MYLVASRPLAAFLPLAVLLMSVLFGWLHPLANGELYSGSLVLLILLALPGQFSAALGSWTLIGYVIGDFVLSGHSASAAACYQCNGLVDELIRVREPMLLSYVLLFGLIAFVPFLATTLRRATVGRHPSGDLAWAALGVAVQAVVQGALVFVWTNAYPPLIRPIFTWVGSSPTIEVIAPVQTQGMVLVALGVFGGAGRALLETLVPRFSPGAAAAIATRQLRVVRAMPARAPRVAFWLSAPLGGAFLTLLTAGVIGSWLEAVLLFTVFTASFLLRRVVWRVPVWADLMRRIPLVVRLAAGAVASYAIATLVLQISSEQTSFFPLVISTALSVLVIALLLPASPTATATTTSLHGRSQPAGVPDEPPTPAVLPETPQ
jgi:hypothetical protein